MMRRLNKTVHIYAAGVIVEKDEKLLLVKEGSKMIPEIYEKWNLPMGRMEKDERPEDCALREGWEETGFLLKIGEKISSRNQSEGYSAKIGVIDMFVYLFEATIIGGEMKVPSDLLNVRFFSLKEIEDLKKQGMLVNPYVISAIKDYNELIFKRLSNEMKEELK